MRMRWMEFNVGADEEGERACTKWRLPKSSLHSWANEILSVRLVPFITVLVISPLKSNRMLNRRILLAQGYEDKRWWCVPSGKGVGVRTIWLGFDDKHNTWIDKKDLT